MNTCLNVTGLGLVLELSNLHGELPGVCAGHGRCLAGGEDAHGPDVHGGLAVLAAQEDAALVQVRGHRAVVRREVVRQAAVHTLTQRPAHHQHHRAEIDSKVAVVEYCPYSHLTGFSIFFFALVPPCPHQMRL